MKNPDDLERFHKNVEGAIERYGESPRYTRPDERKQDLFPPEPKDENAAYAKNPCDGRKQHYCRIHNEDGIQLFVLKSDKSQYNKTIYVPCDEYMVAVSGMGVQRTLERLAEFGNDIKGEIERIVNKCLAEPESWVDEGFARIAGRLDEANAHNAPIRIAREERYARQAAEREAKRLAEEQAWKEEQEREAAEAAQKIREAETLILNRQKVENADIYGDKSLIMQLFRENKVDVPLATQGWIIRSLHDIYFHEEYQDWNYRYNGGNSKVFHFYLNVLVSAIQDKYANSEAN